jgi:putative membrane protein
VAWIPGVSHSVAAIAARLAERAICLLNYRLLRLTVLLFLAVMTFAFAGTFGRFIFFLSTVVGLIAPVAGIHRTHAMGVLMLPPILRYI